MARDPNGTAVDYGGILQANLDHVFNERDAARRSAAIAELYDPEAVLYEPGTEAKGHIAIGEAVETLLAKLPRDFAFTVIAPGVGHHGVGRLRWQSGPRNGPAVVTGTDVALVEDGRIIALYVFLDA